jgi:hypothetical protein
MSTKQRERLNVSVSTMNPVNEEDEPLPDTSPLTVDPAVHHEATIDDSTLDDTPAPFSHASEHLKLRTNIDTVFKSLPPCQQLVNLDKDNRRLEALEQLLIDRLINTAQSPLVPQTAPELPERPSSAAFSSDLATSYLSRNPRSPEALQTPPPQAPPTDRTQLDLNNLQLTAECLRPFSRERLLGQTEPASPSSSFRSDRTVSMTTADQLALHANAKQIRHLSLRANKLALFPTGLLRLFRKLEHLDFSANLFQVLKPSQKWTP